MLPAVLDCSVNSLQIILVPKTFCQSVQPKFAHCSVQFSDFFADFHFGEFEGIVISCPVVPFYTIGVRLMSAVEI